jgi:flagellar basal-body rod protein FlgF
MDLTSTIAASRLVAQERAMEVSAANLANANTPGYQAARVQFSDWLSRQTGAGLPAGEKAIAYAQDRATWRDTRPGTLSHTGNPLDLALPGGGFFTVDTARGPRLTRDGRFGLLPDGTLADGSGNAVLDSNGRPIQFAPTDTQIAIAGNGTISTQNGQIARVGVVAPADPMRLQAEGDTLFRADTPTAPVVAPGMVQGAVESSNVQPIMELTRMMSGVREFQSVAQFIQAEADRQHTAIDKLLPSNS